MTLQNLTAKPAPVRKLSPSVIKRVAKATSFTSEKPVRGLIGGGREEQGSVSETLVILFIRADYSSFILKSYILVLTFDLI
jgi:hypothetical protein